MEEALYMLSGSYTHPAVRARAVAVLQQKADDNIIYDYMIQLVQCIRHDGQGDSAPLASARDLRSIVFTQRLSSELMTLANVAQRAVGFVDLKLVVDARSISDLSGADFLVERCWHNTRLAVALHWSLIVDCDDVRTRGRIGRMQMDLYAALQEHNPSAHDAVNGQVRFKAFLDQFSKEVRVLSAVPDQSALEATPVVYATHDCVYRRA